MSRVVPFLVLLFSSYTFLPPKEAPKSDPFTPLHARVEIHRQRGVYINAHVDSIYELAEKIMEARVSKEDALQWARLFYKYSKQTGVDHRLLASIAYQESRFTPTAYNPNDPSWGMMQVMPRYWRYSFVTECGTEATPETLVLPEVSICYGAYIARHFGAYSIAQADRVTAYNNGTGRLNGYHRLIADAYRMLGG